MTIVHLYSKYIEFKEEDGSGEIKRFNLTEKESESLVKKFYEFTKELSKYQGYYNSNAEVYITILKRNYGYNCEVKEFIVHDTVKNNEYRLLNENEAIQLLEMLRDKYRK